MNILSRISRLFKADIHGILDSLEAPEVILKQAVRDMQHEIDKATARIATLTQQQAQLQHKCKSLNEHIQALQQQLNFCLQENNDALSKSVIKKKLQAELSLTELSKCLKTVSEKRALDRLETEERKDKLQSIRDKLALFSEQTQLHDTPQKPSVSTEPSQDDIELALLYEKQRYAETTAYGEQS